MQTLFMKLKLNIYSWNEKLIYIFVKYGQEYEIKSQ